MRSDWGEGKNFCMDKLKIHLATDVPAIGLAVLIFSLVRIPFVFITLFWIPMALWLVIAFVSYIIGLGLFVLNTKRKSSLLVFIAAELLMCISPVIAILYFCFSEYCGP